MVGRFYFLFKKDVPFFKGIFVSFQGWNKSLVTGPAHFAGFFGHWHWWRTRRFSTGTSFCGGWRKKWAVLFFLKSDKLGRFLQTFTSIYLCKNYTHTVYYILYIKHSLVDNKYVKWTNIENFHVEVLVFFLEASNSNLENMQIFFNAYHFATLQTHMKFWQTVFSRSHPESFVRIFTIRLDGTWRNKPSIIWCSNPRPPGLPATEDQRNFVVFRVILLSQVEIM